MVIPETYVLSKFYAYSMDPTFRKHDGTYNAGCPICREGKSLGKKKRLFYYPKTNTFHCFNCSRTWSAYSWIQTTSGLTRDEIFSEIQSKNNSVDVTKKLKPIKKSFKTISTLPYDSINLFDEIQQTYYGTNNYFKKALNYIKDRKIESAINKPSSLYISLTDFSHKNRLCIPFYDRNKKILFYQTRSLDNIEPRYLGKEGSDKTIFGLDKIDTSLEYIFIFEGPIDAMFVKNGVSTAGLSMSDIQKTQLNEFPFHEKIWVLDNPSFDQAAKEKTEQLLRRKEKVFNWPDKMPYKDINEMAIFEELDEIPHDVFIKNVF
jgi:hypothetical protein